MWQNIKQTDLNIHVNNSYTQQLETTKFSDLFVVQIENILILKKKKQFVSCLI